MIRLKNKLSVARITHVGVILTLCIIVAILLYILWLHRAEIDSYEKMVKISIATTSGSAITVLNIILYLIWEYAKKNNK